jgi:hypothetical protein
MSGQINATVRDAGHRGVMHCACMGGKGDRLGSDTNLGKMARLLREQQHDLRILGALSARRITSWGEQHHGSRTKAVYGRYRKALSSS